jgi:hypothetical protein
MLKVLKESQKPTLTVTGGIPMPGITIATTDQIIPIYDVNKSESTFFNYRPRWSERVISAMRNRRTRLQKGFSGSSK